MPSTEQCLPWYQKGEEGREEGMGEKGGKGWGGEGVSSSESATLKSYLVKSPTSCVSLINCVCHRVLVTINNGSELSAMSANWKGLCGVLSRTGSWFGCITSASPEKEGLTCFAQ